MKKTTKLIVLCLSVCLLVGALALIVSANVGAQDGSVKDFSGYPELADKTFVTTDKDGEYKGYLAAQFTDAVAAAEGRTVYLNKDWAPESAGFTTRIYASNSFVPNFSVQNDAEVAIYDPGKLTLDLNGKSISFNGVLFLLDNGNQNVKIIGKGEINNVRTVAIASYGAEFSMDATEEIKITNSDNNSALFIFNNGMAGTMRFTGKISFTPSKEDAVIFLSMEPGVPDSREKLHKLILDTADFTVNHPNVAPETASDAPTTFFALSNGIDVKIINGSKLSVDYGRMFTSGLSAANSVVNLGAFLNSNLLPEAGVETPALGIEDAAFSKKIFVEAKDSSLICTNNFRKYTTASMLEYAGSIYYEYRKSAMFLADFENCDIGFNGVAFSVNSYNFAGNFSNTDSTGYRAAHNQITINNCRVVQNEVDEFTHTSTKTGLTRGGVNVKLTNSKVDLGDNTAKLAISYCAFPYTELKDGFIGVLLDEVIFESSFDTSYFGYSNNNASVYNTYGTVYRNVTVLKDGMGALEADNLVTYQGLITKKPVTNYTKSVYDGGDGTYDFSWDGASVSAGTFSWTNVMAKPTTANGLAISEYIDAWGNDCLKYTYTGNYKNWGETPFNYIAPNDGNFSAFQYIVTGYDIASAKEDAWLTAWLNMYSEVAVGRPTYKADGTYTLATEYVRPADVIVINDGSLMVNAAGVLGKNPANYAANVDTGIDLPKGGEWSRITVVFEAVIKNPDSVMISLPASDGGQVDVECVDISWNVHVYANGQLAISADIIDAHKLGYSADGSTADGTHADGSGKGTYYPKALLSKIYPEYMSRMRNGASYGALGEIMIDNIYYTTYKTGTDIGIRNADGALIENAVENPYVNPLASNKNSVIEKITAPTVGKVDGKEYSSEEDLKLAIQEDSFVELLSDFNAPISVDKAFTLVDNGFSVQFVSDTYKVKTYASLNAYKSSVASKDDMKTVNFIYGEEKTKSVKLPIGTVLSDANIPAPKVVKHTWSKDTYEWDSAALAAAFAATDGGVYSVEALNPAASDYVNVKASLTLYSFYRLNLYVPKASGSISDVTVSTDPEGTQLVKISRNTPDGTVDDIDYTEYVMTFALSDTSITKFYVHYNDGGTEKTYTFDYGIPYYAYTVVKDSEAKYSDVEKTLIMDMVNYNLKVLEKLGGSKEDEGARIYELMLNNSNYSKFVSTAVNDSEFLAGGDIYTNEISKIPERTDKLPGTETDIIGKYAMYYTNLGPHFVVKISDEAAAAVGVSINTYYGNTSMNGIALYFANSRGGKYFAAVEVNPKGELPDGINGYNGECGKGSATDVDGYDFYWHFYHPWEFSNIYNDTTAETTTNEAVKIVDFVSSQRFEIYIGDGATTTPAVGGEFHFSLAGYINQLLTDKAAASAKGDEETAASLGAEIELAKALYAFAKSAKAFAE